MKSDFEVVKEVSTGMLDRSIYDDASNVVYTIKAEKGLSDEVVRRISAQKQEPEWMLQLRLKALECFNRTPMPQWGPGLSDLDISNITFYMHPGTKESTSWEDVPEEIKRTFERLGIPEAERTSLAGAGAQFESEMVYHNLKKEWEDKGVIFENTDVAMKKYPELLKKYFMTRCIPITDHKFIMLHAAVWSGGTFIYVPEGVKVTIPLQAYFRMNEESAGQFEHTLIIAAKNSEVHYIEGCFTKGTPILANPGVKAIEKVEVGDRVLTHKGRYKKVYHVQKRPYSGKLYTVKVWGDSTTALEVTREHPLFSVKREKNNERNSSWKLEWRTPEELRKGDYLAVPRNKKTKARQQYDFDIMLREKPKAGRLKKTKVTVTATKEFFRLMGYYLAEGSVSKDAYLNFSFGVNERSYVEDVRRLMKKVFGIEKAHEFVHKKNNGVSIVFGSSRIARVFKHLGSSAGTKNMPPWAMQENLQKQKELIIGLFRGDGSYYRKKHRHLKEAFRINTVSERLAKQTRDILLRLGMVAFVNKREREKEGRQAMYTVGVTGAGMAAFGKIVGVPIKERLNNKRRATRFYMDDNYAYVPIREISKRDAENLPVYNFSVEEDESYVAGIVAAHNCSAPRYNANSLHAGAVEIYVGEGAHVKYSSIENWSKNTYNLNTKRAIVEKSGIMEWVGGNMGSKRTMLYPCSILKGESAMAHHISIAFAGKDQNQDTGAKVYHLAPNTASTIKSKSICKDGGVTTYRGLVFVSKGAAGAKVHASCDALMMDDISKNNTVPYMDIKEKNIDVVHEATVGKLSADKLFYLQSRGLSEEQATKLIINGFMEPIVKELPLEYALELNRLIELEMEHSIG